MQAEKRLMKSYGAEAAGYLRFPSADPKLIAIAHEYLPQLKVLLQADLESGPAWCPNEVREVFRSHLSKLLRDIEPRLDEMARIANVDIDQILMAQLASSMAAVANRPFNFTCANCNHEFHETFGWLEANESVPCPGCSATLVLDFKQRGTLTNAQASLETLLKSARVFREVIREIGNWKQRDDQNPRV